MKGSFGRNALEKKFDEQLQGESGAAICLRAPAGYKITSPDLPHRLPVQGHNIRISLDIDLQQAAEKAMEGRTGAAVALDVRTGEGLVLASMPNYDLNSFVPGITQETFKGIEDAGGWINRPIQGPYPPGSTFQLITPIARPPA